MNTEPPRDKPPIAFILSWERPLYLWASLDSFYRATKSPCRFVIADNASKDPLVSGVISGFERRGMFHAVHRCADNHPRRFEKLIEQYWDEIGEFFVFIEADTAVIERKRCWLETIGEHMAADPEIASIGSRVYKGDFVSMAKGRELRPDLPEKDLEFLIKANAPMRAYRHTTEPLISPHNPPLRLLAVRKAAYEQVGFQRDLVMHKMFLKLGWKSMISTEIVHRHLSLLNIYDYSDYDRSHRDAFFTYDT